MSILNDAERQYSSHPIFSAWMTFPLRPRPRQPINKALDESLCSSNISKSFFKASMHQSEHKLRPKNLKFTRKVLKSEILCFKSMFITILNTSLDPIRDDSRRFRIMAKICRKMSCFSHTLPYSGKHSRVSYAV